ncbi:MAG: M14 family metallopeptidase [bacterium]
MSKIFTKGTTIVSIIFIAIILGIIIYFTFLKNKPPIIPTNINTVPKIEVIGKSTQGRSIEAYNFGNGKTHIAFVGGIHGGYEWNSVLLAYQFIDYLNATTTFIPSNMTISVIPSANPDGVYKVIGREGRFSLADIKSDVSKASGRFNANNIDLNRNFDCNWQATSTWQNKIVSAGTSAFSEPEAKAIRDFVLKYNPTAVIFWHSKSNAVYASECKAGILPETINIMNTYSKASGYKAIKTFDSYAITGDAEGWLASINIPAITVELKTHENIEWAENLAGIKALLNYYRK